MLLTNSYAASEREYRVSPNLWFAPMRTALLHWLVPLLGGLIALLAAFFLYRDLDSGRFLAALASANPVWLAVLCLTILFEQLLRGFKWRHILFNLKPVSAFRLFGSILAGYGANVLVPLGISPLVRSWIIARLEGLRFASVITTSAIDRFIDGVIFALIAGSVAVFGTLPQIEGNLRLGLLAAGLINLALFGGLLSVLFMGRNRFREGRSLAAKTIDWIASRGGKRFQNIRHAIVDGILWPHENWRRAAIVILSIAMKGVAASHFIWAGLAVGVILSGWDYLFLFLFAGFSLVLARFVRIPGGFIIGSGYALQLLGVAEEPALATILFIHVLTIVLMIVPGLFVLLRSGVTIRSLRQVTAGTENTV